GETCRTECVALVTSVGERAAWRKAGLTGRQPCGHCDPQTGVLDSAWNRAAALRQKVKRRASCTSRGSPTPCRRKPSKLNRPGVTSGFTLFLLLNELNISTVGMSW